MINKEDLVQQGLAITVTTAISLVPVVQAIIFVCLKFMCAFSEEILTCLFGTSLHNHT